jgi:hypothetical protein
MLGPALGDLVSRLGDDGLYEHRPSIVDIYFMTGRTDELPSGDVTAGLIQDLAASARARGISAAGIEPWKRRQRWVAAAAVVAVTALLLTLQVSSFKENLHLIVGARRFVQALAGDGRDPAHGLAASTLESVEATAARLVTLRLLPGRSVARAGAAGG